jgi:hypothetical protein
LKEEKNSKIILDNKMKRVTFATPSKYGEVEKGERKKT